MSKIAERAVDLMEARHMAETGDNGTELSRSLTSYSYLDSFE